MITKQNVCDQVLATIPAGQKITLDDAIAKAEAIKHIKNKNPKAAWRFFFKLQGVVTKEQKVVYVAPKTVVTPQVEAPKVETPVVQTVAPTQ